VPSSDIYSLQQMLQIDYYFSHILVCFICDIIYTTITSIKNISYTSCMYTYIYDIYTQLLSNLPYPAFSPLQQYLIIAALSSHILHVLSLQPNAVESSYPDKYILYSKVLKWPHCYYSHAYPTTKAVIHILYIHYYEEIVSNCFPN
jgi:hypothetical protein